MTPTPASPLASNGPERVPLDRLATGTKTTAPALLRVAGRGAPDRHGATRIAVAAFQSSV